MIGLDCHFDEPMACHESAFLEACIEYKIASTRWEREAAFRLLYRAYNRAGLIESHPDNIRVTPYHLLPATSVMVARYANQVISTLTLIEDGEIGLPMEQIFGSIVHEQRQQGLTLAEVSCLADRRRNIQRSFPVFVRLCRLMIQCARHRGIDQLLIAVHPRHVRLYTNYLAFRKIGDERPYPLVRNHPAVALSLDLNRLDIEQPINYQRFFAVELDARQLELQPMSDAERRYFARFLADADDRSCQDSLNVSPRSAEIATIDAG
jgi:N-acyl-L-homoserine lactone synthetase